MPGSWRDPPRRDGCAPRDHCGMIQESVLRSIIISARWPAFAALATRKGYGRSRTEHQRVAAENVWRYDLDPSHRPQARPPAETAQRARPAGQGAAWVPTFVVTVALPERGVDAGSGKATLLTEMRFPLASLGSHSRRVRRRLGRAGRLLVPARLSCIGRSRDPARFCQPASLCAMLKER
jgi:hypothetical protein